MRLLFNIDHQHISVTRGQSVVSDSVRYLTAQFGFSEDWDGTAKTAIFSGKGGTYEVILTNDSCTVPHEVISGRFGVSVFGVRNGVRITTDTAYLCVQQSGYTPGETPSEPTPSVYEQLMDKITDEEMTRQMTDEMLSDIIDAKADKTVLEAETAARKRTDNVLEGLRNGETIGSFAEVEKELVKKADKEAVPKKVSDLTDDLNLAKTDENNNFTASQTITGTLTVNGNIVQNGTSYESHAEQLYTKNDLIKTRDGAVGGLGDGEYTGIEAEKYDGENNGRLVFDANGTARVGDVGSEQPLLTREEAANLDDYNMLIWDATNVKATGLNLGPGTAIATKQDDKSKWLMVYGATTNDIDERETSHRPITPATLDYAVRSVLPKTADTIPSTLVANTEYYAGELATVSFALPTTGKLGQYCFVKFDSGATATTLTVTGSYAGDIPTPIANKTYEILATWNGSKWVCSYRGY